jgi:hypothetical protein
MKPEKFTNMSKLEEMVIGSMLFEGESIKRLPAPFDSYYITTRGRLLSCKTHIKFLDNHLRNGYRSASLVSNDGVVRKEYVHRIMCAAFFGVETGHKQGLVARHLDGNPENNRIENLAVGTFKENAEDRDRHGRTARGEKHGQSKMTARQVKMMRLLWENREDMPFKINYRTLGRMFNIAPSPAKSIVQRETWKHI